ncbi:MAG: MFS transporter [Methanomassiliicoccus sp.]|nr:MFS transporter [Methanomassiliicoccus sp.]
MTFGYRHQHTTWKLNSHELDAFKLVFLIGAISLFADMTADGYYSVVGTYLGSLGATAALVTLITGIAGLVTYTPRLASGWYCDHTHHYWRMLGAGLLINFIAVPMLALADHWELAFGLIVFQRVGQALRAPARDSIISHAAKGMGGVGRAFGLHEAMSDVGSMIGPIVVALILQANMGYGAAFSITVVPAILAIIILFLSRRWYPHPMGLEVPHATKHRMEKGKLPRLFWIYLLGAGLLAAAYIDFPLISYHLSSNDHLQDFWIPVLYAVAMGLDAISALVLGHFFDRLGMTAIVAVFALSSLFVPLVFASDLGLMVLGIMLWGVGQGAMGSILRGAVSNLVPADRRGAGFGTFSTIFGIMWFLGNALAGLLYSISLPLMIAASVSVQLLAVIIFAWIDREAGMKHKGAGIRPEKKEWTARSRMLRKNIS